MRSRATRRRRRATLLLALAGVACGHLVDPPLPQDAELLVPPPIYTKWWQMVEDCSGLSASLANVQWYATATSLRDPNNAERIDGYWSAASNRIVLADRDTLAGAIVRHEMLHSLLQVGGHPRWAFLEKCGGVVSCQQQCVEQGGSPATPPAGTPTVDPSQLEVTTSVSPEQPSAGVDAGLALFTITVRNPLSHGVVVAVPLNNGVRTGYESLMREQSGLLITFDVPILDPGLTYFAPGETKHQLIDFAVLPPEFPSYQGIPGFGEAAITLGVGNYVFFGEFAGKQAAPLDVVVTP